MRPFSCSTPDWPIYGKRHCEVYGPSDAAESHADWVYSQSGADDSLFPLLVEVVEVRDDGEKVSRWTVDLDYEPTFWASVAEP